jgi:endonuclease/exonuclease/phosphatase family metal-dependent hydrolase
VSSWDEANKHKNGGQSHRRDMLALIQAQNADILCLQEFFEFESSNFYEPNIPAVKALGYPYYYFVPHYFRYKKAYRMGVAIFSKYPIKDTAVIPYQQNTAADNLVYADIDVKGKTIRLMTTHLQSVRFDPVDYEGINKIKNTDDYDLEASKTILSKIIKAYRFRSGQAEQVREEIEKSPYPVIICGDFNDVPNSYTYFTIKGDLKDAFIAKGSGIGKTLRILGPTLRIDYILADKELPVAGFNKFNVPYSDHYPIMADILLE